MNRTTLPNALVILRRTKENLDDYKWRAGKAGKGSGDD